MAWQVRLGEKETLPAKWTVLPSPPTGLLPGLSCASRSVGGRVSTAVKETTCEAPSDEALDSSKGDTTGGRGVLHFVSIQRKFQMVGLTCPESESSRLFSCTRLVRLYSGQHQQSTASESVGAGIHR